MAKVTPQEWAADWSSRIGQSLPKIERGIRAVSTAPTQAAKAKQAKLVQNFNAAVTSGKWARGLDRVTLADWQTATINKGLPRIGQGAQAAVGKVEAFAAKMIPFQDAIKSKLATMSDMTLEDNIARSAFVIREMAKFKNT